MALQVQSSLFSCGTVGERDVIVANLVEEVNFVSLQHKSGSNRVNGSVTPTLVEETAIVIQGIEVLEVSVRTQPVQIADLKV